MRSRFGAVMVALAVGAPIPALAAARHHKPAPSYDTCEALSLERGAAPGEGNSGNPDGQHNAFIRQCLQGKIPR
jgi:hypothetical protein